MTATQRKNTTKKKAIKKKTGNPGRTTRLAPTQTKKLPKTPTIVSNINTSSAPTSVVISRPISPKLTITPRVKKEYPYTQKVKEAFEFSIELLGDFGIGVLILLTVYGIHTFRTNQPLTDFNSFQVALIVLGLVICGKGFRKA